MWKEGGGAGIDQPANGQPFCFRFLPDRQGDYYFTLRSKAPQFTEHNDVWLQSSSAVKLYRPSSKSLKAGAPSQWFKVFQNLGKKKVADYVLSGDNNGHQVFLAAQKGRAINVCVAGRSTKFTIYDFIFIHCTDLGECDRHGKYVTDALADLRKPSKCT